jgi:E3 ubiquitin-protein ligase RNF14
MDTVDDDERAEELSSLQAIFPDELVVDPAAPYIASIDLPVALQDPVSVVFPPLTEPAPPVLLPGSTSSSRRDIHRLSFLPPLHLEIALPEGYPADEPPHVKLTAQAEWISHNTLTSLEKEAVTLWEDYGHGQVLFSYISLLQEAAERAFDLTDGYTGEVELPHSTKIALLDYDIKAKRQKFEKQTFDCSVCLEPKKGSACYRIERCQHVFCVACLQDFYNNCILEGDVNGVKCLSPDCGKERPGDRRRKKQRLLTPNELLQIPLERSAVQRYVDLKRKKKMESDKTTVYCPRQWCQGAARSKKYPKIKDLSLVPESDSDESEAEAPEEEAEKPDKQKGDKNSDRLSICEDCNYAFCNVCLAGWHGEFIRCYPRDASELTQEEQASMNYILSNTTPCPTCDVPCQKTHGCNHMRCFQCKTHFCYLCSSWLNPDNPYEHFNNPKKSCFQRLWELEEGDEGDGNGGFVGVRGAEAAAQRAEQAAMELQMQEMELVDRATR